MYVQIIPTPIMAIIDGGHHVTFGQYRYIFISFQLSVNSSSPVLYVAIYLSHDGIWWRLNIA